MGVLDANIEESRVETDCGLGEGLFPDKILLHLTGNTSSNHSLGPDETFAATCLKYCGLNRGSSQRLSG